MSKLMIYNRLTIRKTGLLMASLFLLQAAHAQQKLIACTEPVFDLGNVSQKQYGTSVDIHWKIQNVSDGALLCPVQVPVWNDCDIQQRFGHDEWLKKNETRDVILRVMLYYGTGPHKKEGTFTFSGTSHGKKVVQNIPVSVKLFMTDSTRQESLK